MTPQFKSKGDFLMEVTLGKQRLVMAAGEPQKTDNPDKPWERIAKAKIGMFKVWFHWSLEKPDSPDDAQLLWS